jgi:hypothetical protein
MLSRTLLSTCMLPLLILHHCLIVAASSIQTSETLSNGLLPSSSGGVSSSISSPLAPSGSGDLTSSTSGSQTSAPSETSILLSSAVSLSRPQTETGVQTLPISHYSFASFPAPSGMPFPDVYPDTDPKNPPPPGSELIPDFNPAWAKALKKAKAKVRFSALLIVFIEDGSGVNN